MLTARDLFPRDETAGPGITLQGRILMRVSGGLIRPSDIRVLEQRGALSPKDNPDQVHGMAIHG